jgi:hypothetical protein
MYTIANQELEVAILDPVADQDHFGVRYCTGGYIFQVSDNRLGDLLTGPTYPDSFNWFDGQGIPDAFHQQPLRDPASQDPIALLLGIGLCNPVEKTIEELCTWEVTQTEQSIRMRTLHTFATYAVELVRTVSLHGRTVRSHTLVTNRGNAQVPMRWYPHPFYPQPETDELIKLNIPLGPIENEAYALAENGYIQRKGWPWERGYYLALEHSALTNLVIHQKHPKLGLVGATCSYIPHYFPIWGNPNTFSWEPFLERSVGPGQHYSWWIDYEF